MNPNPTRIVKLKVIVYWIIIGLPLGWGLYQSVKKAKPLFSGTVAGPMEAPKK